MPGDAWRAAPEVMAAEDSRGDAAARRTRLASAAVPDVARLIRGSRVGRRPGARPRIRIRRGYGLDGASLCWTSRSGRSSRRRARRWPRFHSATAPATGVASTGRAPSAQRRRPCGCRGAVAMSFATRWRRQCGIASVPSRASPRSWGPSFGPKRQSGKAECQVVVSDRQSRWNSWTENGRKPRSARVTN
jgi:hypothetical protein